MVFFITPLNKWYFSSHCEKNGVAWLKTVEKCSFVLNKYICCRYYRTSIKDGCNDCQCQNGLVRCKVSPLSPILQDDCLQWQGVETTTSPPNGCKFEGTYRYDGEVFTAADECNRCWCNRGEIICPFQDECENIVAKRRSLSTN